MTPGRRVVAALTGLCVLLGIGLVPAPERTEGAWTDPEYVTGSTITAAVLAPPQAFEIHGCHALLGAGVTIDWSWPPGEPYSRFTPANNAQWAFNTAGNNWQAVATVTVGTKYRTAFHDGVIDGLLAFLLGGQMTIRARTKAGTEWVSGPSVKVLYETGLFGSRCSIVP